MQGGARSGEVLSRKKIKKKKKNETHACVYRIYNLKKQCLNSLLGRFGGAFGTIVNMVQIGLENAHVCDSIINKEVLSNKLLSKVHDKPGN